MPVKAYKKFHSHLWNAALKLPVKLAVFTIIFPLFVSSQVIGNWSFTNTIAGTSGTLNTVSTADFSPSIPSRAFNGGSDYFGHDGWPTGGIDLSRYLEFNLTPNTGYALNLSSLVLRMRHSSTGPSGGSGPTRFSIRSSLDGFSTDIATGNLTGVHATFTAMTGTPFHHLPTVITFRVYGYMAVLYTGGLNRLVFDNIQVSGIGLVLPVLLHSFTARSDKDEILINYCLKNTTAGSVYMLERSTTGIQFQSLAYITETETSGKRDYKVTDNSIPNDSAQLYYRLKIREPGGNTFYSPVVTVNRGHPGGLFKACIAGNVLKLSGDLPANPELILYSNSGSCVFRKKINTATPANNFTCTVPPLPSGVYHVLLTEKSGKRSASVFIP